MKKTAAIVLLFSVITVWLTGCTKKTDPFPIQKDFTATVKCEEEMYTVTHNGTEITTVSYCSPKQLQGLTYSYCGDELTVKYGTLHYKPSAPLPENNISILHKVLSSINEQTEQSIKSTNENQTVYAVRSYEITCLTKDGKIQKIHTKNPSKTYTFSEKEKN